MRGGINGSGTVKMQEVAKVENIKYLGSTVQSNGECGREVKKRMQGGWNGFMDVVKEDMAEVEVTEEDTEGRNN